MRKFWKVVRRTLLLLGFTLVLLCLGAALLTYVYEDDIKAMAIKQVNYNLNAKVIIKTSDISLTFFSSFPNTGIRFENFKILELKPGSDSVLAQVGVLNFEFSPFNLINKSYHISRILIKDAVVHIRVDKEGIPNYLILKPDTVKIKNKENIPLDIKLKHIRLKNVRLTYDDLQTNKHLDVQINNSIFAGSFTDAQYSLDANADFVAESLIIGQQRFLSHKEISFDASLNIDNLKKKYSIDHFKLKLEKSVFSANGYVSKQGTGYMTDLSLKGEDANIQTILSLLPGNISTAFKDYQSKGQVSFSGKIKGLSDKGISPVINFSFSIVNGTIQDNKHSLGLQTVNLAGEYTNGKNHDLESSSIHIDRFSAKLNGREVTARFTMDNFNDPLVDMNLKSEINLKDLKNFTTIPGIDSLAGEIALDASFKGKISDLKQYNTINKTKLSGTLTLRKVSVRPSIQQYSYKNMDGYFETNGNDLVVSNFAGFIGRTDFKIKGQFKNLASFLFLPNQKLEAATALESHVIDIDDFIFKSTGKTDNSKTVSRHFDLPAFMAFNFSLKADKIIFAKFEAENVTGQIHTSNKSAYLQNVQMQTFGGTVSLDGNIVDAGQNIFKTTAHINLKQVDVKQGFYELGNFGQTYFTDKYIKGKMDASVDYSSNWNKDLSVDLTSIVCMADITIYDGEIHNFPQFMALGKYLKVKSLDDIYFSEYANRLYIRNSRVEIPKMDIKSSAMNMSLAGTHTFDNVMDYKLKINMSQLLFGNRKNYEDEFGEIEVDQNGGMNIFLTMTGPVSNYKIKYDTKSSIKNVGKGLEQEKAEIDKIFKSNSPNKKEGENLNKASNEYEFSNEKPDDKGTKVDEEQNDGVPPKKKVHTEDSARKNAFDVFKKKLKNH